MAGWQDAIKLETISGVPEGLDALELSRRARSLQTPDVRHVHLHIARDDRRLDALERQLAFFAPDLRVLSFPAWDTVPYDRTSPKPEIVAQRMTTLSKLVLAKKGAPILLLTTVNAFLQCVPPRAYLRQHLKQIAPGQRIDLNRLIERLMKAGYRRTGTVMEPGEFAVRGGLLDLFPPARSNPVRLDFFGDTLESIKAFDADTQRTVKPLSKLALLPTSEMAFGEAATARFRKKYIELFGGVTREDPLYEAISAGQRYQGQEHWLPLYHDSLETLTDYIPEAATVSLDDSVPDVMSERFSQVEEHYEARLDALEADAFGTPPYKPVPPQTLFLNDEAVVAALDGYKVEVFSSFEAADATASAGGRAGRIFAAERQSHDINLFDAVVGHIRSLHESGKRVLLSTWTPGARERLLSLMSEHGLSTCKKTETFADWLGLKPGQSGFAVLGLERGFETPELALIGEQDILGDRLVRPRRKARKASEVLTEATSLAVDDFVVHAEHGIGRFAGLSTITALNAPHDCLELIYAGGDKLYLPVENIELLSRYGSEGGEAQLDRLGGVQWQTRKAKLKKRLHELAGELIKIAALRELRDAPVMTPPEGAYEEFIARFPFEETEDQATSIDAVLADLASGRPMDRLICGDVGFGKTEVALRAAFIAALGGYQVAVVVPTTLLARQHFKTFKERFQGFPVEVAQASRLLTQKDLADVKEGLKSGDIDIVIGTHALLGKAIEFERLGLLVIDEEQHFGVAHKEQLKKMREDVHVLTLSATPIPRTLQLSLTGVRELSLITTPPVDRLAVRT